MLTLKGGRPGCHVLLLDSRAPHLLPGALQGHGRSAVTAAAILMAMGKADTVEEALARLVKASAEAGG